MVFNTYRKSFSLLLGALYVFFIGFGHLPVNLGASAMLIAGYTALLVLIHLNRTHIHLKLYSIILLGYVLAGYLAITSNHLISVITYICNVFILSLLLITLNQQSLFPLTITSYLGKLSHLGSSIMNGFFSKEEFKAYFNLKGFKLKIKGPNGNYVIGAIVAIPVLLIFHTLFTWINADYKSFVDTVFSSIWHYLLYILNIEIIWKSMGSVFMGFLFYVLFQPQALDDQHLSTAATIAQQILKVLLVAVVALFCLFSVFQSQSFFMELSKLPFKELSMYTQRGFWELLGVSVLGYVLASVIFRFGGKSLWEHISNKALLGIYLVELLLICLFTYHKLFSLQYFFGLKDQRVLATAATTLIFLTFILLIGKLFRKVRSSTIFTIQIFGLLLVVLCLNVINLDSFITTTRPISYIINGTKYKDYSYLLTNSYDNNSSWLGLMTEFEGEDVKFPDNYYWGKYRPLCEIPNIQRHWYLEPKYSHAPQDHDISRFSKYNLHEYQAYKLLQSHKTETKEFLIDVTKKCSYDLPASRELFHF